MFCNAVIRRNFPQKTHLNARNWRKAGSVQQQEALMPVFCSSQPHRPYSGNSTALIADRRKLPVFRIATVWRRRFQCSQDRLPGSAYGGFRAVIVNLLRDKILRICSMLITHNGRRGFNVFFGHRFALMVFVRAQMIWVSSMIWHPSEPLM